MTLRPFLCCDLDRTLIPNGVEEESPHARPALAKIATRTELTLAYVSGRRKELIEEGVATWGLPTPAFAVGDVGTTIYEIDGDRWRLLPAWSDRLADAWRGHDSADLADALAGIDGLTAQEAATQSRFKLSYYLDRAADRERVMAEIGRRLATERIGAERIYSVDEEKNVGLLDLLPTGGTKVDAIFFLMERFGFDREATIFCGDSGNDLPALTSGLKAALVKNATEEVRREALARVRAKGIEERLYCATGGFMGMNGNYAAGALEGLCHFIPKARDWL
jgi:HAD superfamily hydrolase (TIGR01484 family)